LPFTKEAWDRASEWLQAQRVNIGPAPVPMPIRPMAILPLLLKGSLNMADHTRQSTAWTGCAMPSSQSIANQCVRALLAALSSSEPSYAMDGYHIVELIKFLQAEPSVNQDDLFKVEWAYVPLLDRHRGAAPKLLESRLANDPEFFCEVIRLIYRSEERRSAIKRTHRGIKGNRNKCLAAAA
jgi:hypothetical protein